MMKPVLAQQSTLGSTELPNPTGTASLTLPDGKSINLPVLIDAAGNSFVDIRTLYGSLGVCTYDPGFTSTASCHSAITYIDGKDGVLQYRGYPIEELAEECDFMDVVHLLLQGDLPTPSEKAELSLRMKSEAIVHEKLIQFFQGFKIDAHPMSIMVGVVGALSSFFHDPEKHSWKDPNEQYITAIRLIAKMPTIAAFAYKYAKGERIVYPKSKFGYGENFLYMMFGLPTEEYKVDPLMARAMEIILLLHCDHEQNASTSTVRIAGSSQANPYACIAAGIASLWGPAHGGANEAVLKMLEQIGSKDRIPEFIAKAKDKDDPFRLMGFGHRVYKTTDPRANIMRRICHQILERVGAENDPLLEIAMCLEKVAKEDEYFRRRNLYPNVDFYSGICLRAMGIPVSMFTVLFSVARTVGWVVQWQEMISDPVPRISRPRQIYVGHLNKKVESPRDNINGRNSML